MNTNLTETFAVLAKDALLEARAGYFGICVLGGNDQGQWRCGSDTAGIATQYQPQEDPLNLLWAITRFKNGIVFCGLMYVLVILHSVLYKFSSALPWAVWSQLG